MTLGTNNNSLLELRAAYIEALAKLIADNVTRDDLLDGFVANSPYPYLDDKKVIILAIRHQQHLSQNPTEVLRAHFMDSTKITYTSLLFAYKRAKVDTWEMAEALNCENLLSDAVAVARQEASSAL